jgi:hypothetical protein
MTSLYDYPISDEIKDIGISRVYKKDKNLVIYNSEFITSRYYSGDLQSTLHHLEKALLDYDKKHKNNNNHFGNEKIQRFLKWFAEIDVKTDEEHQQGQGQGQHHQQGQGEQAEAKEYTVFKYSKDNILPIVRTR